MIELTELALQIERDLGFDFNKSKEIANYFLKLKDKNNREEKRDLITDFCIGVEDILDSQNDIELAGDRIQKMKQELYEHRKSFIRFLED